MGKTDDAIRQAFAVFRDVERHPESYRDDIVVLPLELLLRPGGSPFSRQRLRILQEVRKRPAGSLDELARRLHREKTRVSKDVALLQGLGLIKTRADGRKKCLESASQLLLLE